MEIKNIQDVEQYLEETYNNVELECVFVDENKEKESFVLIRTERTETDRFETEEELIRHFNAEQEAYKEIDKEKWKEMSREQRIKELIKCGMTRKEANEIYTENLNELPNEIRDKL